MIRTDLAMEAFAAGGDSIDGIRHAQRQYSPEIRIETVEILTDSAAEQLGKKQGKYVTVQAEYAVHRDRAHHLEVSKALAGELRKMIPDGKGAVLVVGLGNRKMTPDALGPKTADGVMVTRHLFEMMPEKMDRRVRPVCVFTPGVLGETGMESAQSIRAVADSLRPSCVVAVDSLAAANAERISDTVQMCNCGIAPGAGIGNRRHELSKESLGVPVIAIGVPVVVYAQSIIDDAAQALRDPETANRIETALPEKIREMIVTPKEIDSIISDCARILAKGINLALHHGICSEEIDDYLY